MAKSVLQTYYNMSSYRPNMAVDKYTAYNFSNITWSSYGPYFSQAPKMCWGKIRLLDHDPPPPLLLDHDPSPPRLLDHELSPMIFQVMTQVRSALDVWAPLSLPKQLARENFSLNNGEKNLIL
ncbi:hypothetical protein WN944_022721 [Citrus x changshan-huyou]|uniref:Uncharacterized protein n=1 Tax=Citrus x changshan-huyou TaxID=2935761 RepID=A0AAP0R0M7_9ROSI